MYNFIRFATLWAYVLAASSVVLGAQHARGDARPALALQVVPPPPQPQNPPPGYVQPPAYADPGRVHPSSYFTYEAAKKSEGIALAVELLFPGVGSFYADHAVGALVTWGCLVGGFTLVLRGIEENTASSLNNEFGSTSSSQPGDTSIRLGVGLILGGRIYGFYDAYTSVSRWNRELRGRLGLEFVGLGIVPLSGPHRGVLAPTLGFRF